MDIITWFGDKISGYIDAGQPAKARKLLLAGYRAAFLTLKMPFYNTDLNPARRFSAQEAMKVMIGALAHPENSAMVSLFVPCEPILTAGLVPYSAEAVSGYIVGSYCEQYFMQRAAENGAAETMCSYHRTFLGAAQTGLLPPPPFIIYTNLACDGNMITFPNMKKEYGVPTFFIEVPYEKIEDAVHDVARQLEQMTVFIEDSSHRKIDEDKLKASVRRSRKSAEKYRSFLFAESERRLSSDLTGEMFGVFMSHLLLGSAQAEKFFTMLDEEIKEAPKSDALRILWIHAVPHMQPSLRDIINFSDKVYITSCDLCYDSLMDAPDENDPYVYMARRMVYSGFNGTPDQRIKNAIDMAKRTNADGVVIFAHWGCKATIGASQLMKTAIEAQGLPTLVLDGDACCPANSGDGQLATRMQAFIEMLEDRRK